MSSVERLESALRQLRRRGYVIRQEWLGGRGGGACQLRGQPVLFLDLAQSVDEHLDLAEQALQGCDLPEASRQAA